MRDPETLQIVLVRPEGGPPDMEGVQISQSWSYLIRTDEPVITWDELTREIDKATTPSDRTVHVEIDESDWGASEPLEVVYQVALALGFEAAVKTLATWIKGRLDGVEGVLSDIENAARLAMRYLKRHHKVTSPEIESVEKTLESINFVIGDGNRRFSVKVFGKEALIVEVELLDG